MGNEVTGHWGQVWLFAALFHAVSHQGSHFTAQQFEQGRVMAILSHIFLLYRGGDWGSENLGTLLMNALPGKSQPGLPAPKPPNFRTISHNQESWPVTCVFPGFHGLLLRGHFPIISGSGDWVVNKPWFRAGVNETRSGDLWLSNSLFSDNWKPTQGSKLFHNYPERPGHAHIGWIPTDMVDRALDLSQTCIPTLGICSATLTLGPSSNSLGLHLFLCKIQIIVVVERKLDNHFMWKYYSSSWLIVGA